MLSNSYNIRRHTENMIVNSNTGNWVEWAKAVGGLLTDLAYFEYDVTAASMDGVYL